MNLFWLDSDVTRCAQAHQDTHVGKMLLEAVQLLCTAFVEPRRGWACPDASASVSKTPYRWQDLSTDQRLAADLLPYSHTHINHPCALWVRASRANFNRAIELAEALAAEFRYRFDKPHGSEASLDWVKCHRSEAQVPDGPLTPYVLAMPEEYQQSRAFFCTGCKSLFNHPVNARVSCETCKRLLWPCDNTTDAYRAYYRAEKRGHWRKSRDPSKPSTWVPAKWTRRDPPEWF